MSAKEDRTALMEKIVALCKRRGFVFQDSEIYGGQNGFWDYGPLGTELKRNVRNAWWEDMVSRHDPLDAPTGAPSTYQMVGVETSIIMHPQVWKCSGHYDLFHDMMVDCKQCKARYRADHLQVRFGYTVSGQKPVVAFSFMDGSDETKWSTGKQAKLQKETTRRANDQSVPQESSPVSLPEYLHQIKELFQVSDVPDELLPSCPKSSCGGQLTEPREFNLMFKTIIGALGTDDDAAFLRPETAQGIFVNFKNVIDSNRVKLPLGICQIGKSFRNEITPRNFTFRSREFEQMEIEFFCAPGDSQQWYQYWRDRRFAWYQNLGISQANLQLRDHHKEELAHYSIGTADIEYRFPFLAEGEYGELEGVAHRGDFDLRSHMEGKLTTGPDGNLIVETNEHGQPKYRGSGKDLSYFDDQTRERFVPHVIEPSAGADRATLAFICEAYYEDEAPDDKGKMQTRTVMKFHPRLAPVKAAVFPLVKKDGQPEKAKEIYRELREAGLAVTYDEQAAIGKRYRRQDEAGTPWCITVDNDTLSDGTVTLRDRDSLEQVRLPSNEVTDEILRRMKS
ncbi:MAG: glycine--tRNA ligase [Planctomycetaceae bacterium]|nr:glycine--tRNA ligase [Planctomycetaceae bacterium]